MNYLGLWELARKLGNVSHACKVKRFSQDSFYRFKEIDNLKELDLQMRTSSLAVALLLASVFPCLADTNNGNTSVPYTTFQTDGPYRAEHDIRTDAVMVYSNDKAWIQSWKEKGYNTQMMYGFKTMTEYALSHCEDVQTLADGMLRTCDPWSYYMVPSENRIKAMVDYFTKAVKNGATAIIPEEPEFWAEAGYSESFKKAWLAYYGKPWVDPASSIEARYASERLKAQMECNMIKAILDAAKQKNADVRRIVACHSPVNYFSWRIIYPHYQCLNIPSLQELVGQVWTGTARTACRYAGKVEERTFENGFLEYSSLYNLARGTGKRLWFIMDPLEDNLTRTMEDYNSNYIKTLVASLMFPGVDSYEVMPWPVRIFGRVPDEFATEIMTIVNALGDIHNQKTAQLDTGTTGIATFVADSMGWQRATPYVSNFDCFYGLTLPLIYSGVPVQVAQLERAPEKNYLKPYKVLLVSYDILKPMKPEYNQALADWVKAGGVLVSFGGTDAYNALNEWWTKRGFSSPQADLYARLGVRAELRSFSGPQTSTVLDRDESSFKLAMNANTPLGSLCSSSINVSADFPLTLANVTSGGICSAKGLKGSTIFERKVGKGAIIHVGISPSWFAASGEGADMLRALAQYSCEKAGLRWHTQQNMGVRRGKYVAIRTLDGEKKLKGAYVNLLDPNLAVVADPVVAPQKCAFYCEVTSALKGRNPGLLYSSSKIEKKSETPAMIKLKVSGPIKTKGTARIYTAGRSIESISPSSVKMEQSGKTVLLTYDNIPESVDVEVKWR